MFLSKRVICMFHVNLPGCTRKVTFESVFPFGGIWIRSLEGNISASEIGPQDAPKRKPASGLV